LDGNSSGSFPTASFDVYSLESLGLILELVLAHQHVFHILKSLFIL